MVIWLTGIPGVGKRPLAEALKRQLQNGKRIQVLDASEVRAWMHPELNPQVEHQVAAVAWIARLLASNEIDVIVCCMAPIRRQRTSMRHRFYEECLPFHEVWVHGQEITEDLERSLGYERPDPPDSWAVVDSYDGWDDLARHVISELDL
jgi:adenylylsulfate kinase-like enzyme